MVFMVLLLRIAEGDGGDGGALLVRLAIGLLCDVTLGIDVACVAQD
jgi:hypothetical protein